MARLACLKCDLLINTINVQQHERSNCPRCHETIFLQKQNYSFILALILTALTLYLPAILLPFIQLEVSGLDKQVSLLSSILVIATNDTFPLALTVALLVLIFPLMHFLGLLLIMLPLSQNKLPYLPLPAVRFVLKIAPWSMMEVYIVGVLVSFIKLISLATVSFSLGFYLFILMVLVNAIISTILPKKRIWQSIAQISDLRLLSANEPNKR